MLLRCNPIGLPTAFAFLVSAAISTGPLGFETAQAAETTIYNFAGGTDGSGLNASFASDTQGTLYVIANTGGSSGQGTLFKLTPPWVSGKTQWTKTALYTFNGQLGGGNPEGVLNFDTQGSLYGVAEAGGSSSLGLVYKLTPPWVSGKTLWTESVLYNFPSSFNGSGKSGLTLNSQGALYGTTTAGGNSNAGTIYKLTPVSGTGQWNMTVLYNFTGHADGGWPVGRAIFDTQGALYGTTANGGSHGFGAVYKLTPPTTPTGQWAETVLYSFKGGADGFGRNPVHFDHQGALYGSTYPTSVDGAHTGSSTLFKLTPPSGSGAWSETVIYTFPAGSSGGAGTFDTQGALYTPFGGTSNAGSVIKLTPVAGQAQWKESTVYTFQGKTDGAIPSGLTFGPGGVLYGITSSGGTSGHGTVFQISTPSCQ